MKTEDLVNLLKAVKEIPLPGEKSVSMVDEIIKRLEEYDELKSTNEGLVDFLESVSDTLKKQSEGIR